MGLRRKKKHRNTILPVPLGIEPIHELNATFKYLMDKRVNITLQENPSAAFAICMTFLAPGFSVQSMRLNFSIPIARSPSIATLRRKYTSVGRPKCSDSPFPPGKSGPGSPCKKVSRWRARYSAFPSVTGQTGMYMTLESDFPMCTLSTAWIAGRNRGLAPVLSFD